MENEMRIGFIGGGRIAHAMATGFIGAGLVKPEKVIASCHPSDKICIDAFKNLGASAITENTPVVQRSDVIFISVKPSVVPQALESVAHVSNGKLFISVAMGVTIKEIESKLQKDARVIRVMPNTPALIRQACSVFVRGKNATSTDAEITTKLLKSIGTCEEVTENLMDPITALSGSGPAYIFILIEALADGGVKMGLSRDLSYKLATQTVAGSAMLVQQSGKHPAQLKDDVASPAGSTIAGIKSLEENGFRAAIINAIEAATNRCKEISNTK